MQDRQPTPADCLEGARLGVANATSLFLASSHLRRRGFAREAVLLLATAIEEAAKAGVLHRAWMVGDEPLLFQKVIDGWRTMTFGRGSHERKHASAPYLGSTNFTVVFIAGILADLLSKERSGSSTSKALDALFGSAPRRPPGGMHAFGTSGRQSTSTGAMEDGLTWPGTLQRSMTRAASTSCRF